MKLVSALVATTAVALFLATLLALLFVPFEIWVYVGYATAALLMAAYGAWIWCAIYRVIKKKLAERTIERQRIERWTGQYACPRRQR